MLDKKRLTVEYHPINMMNTASDWPPLLKIVWPIDTIVGVCDRDSQRSVLGEVEVLRPQWWQYDPEGLRKHDQPERHACA